MSSPEDHRRRPVFRWFPGAYRTECDQRELSVAWIIQCLPPPVVTSRSKSSSWTSDISMSALVASRSASKEARRSAW